eukprot:TRINITY_DN26626_c0_g1_i1.p1 TRINITY_DN26626_c0_g1~~TRINITY_DN26626_c0_g1_i1.p1  ORF type:complete len:944 (+),score=291.23 TRINITY_DN26626_c0_g1_i1:283-2832(+)
MPAPPLMQAQLQQVATLIDSKLKLAQCAPLEDAARLLHESHGALTRLLKELPNLSAHMVEPPSAVAWSELYEEFRSLPVVLPKARYEAYFGGRVFVNCVPRTASDHATRPQIQLMCPQCQKVVAPHEWTGDSADRRGEFAQALTRKKLSAVIATRRSKRISEILDSTGRVVHGPSAVSRLSLASARRRVSESPQPPPRSGSGSPPLALARQSTSLPFRIHCNVGVQTEPSREEEEAEEREEVLRQQIRAVEQEKRKLLAVIEAQRIAMDTLKGRLAAKTSAVRNLRVNLWDELCMLRQRLIVAQAAVASASSAAAAASSSGGTNAGAQRQQQVQDDYADLVSMMDSAFTSLEDTSGGSGPGMTRKLAAEIELEKVVRERAEERAEWNAHRRELEKRFKTVVHHKNTEIRRIHSKSKLPALFVEVQGLFQEVYQHHREIRQEAREIAAKFALELGDFQGEYKNLVRQVNAQLAYEKQLKVRLRHMEELFRCFIVLIEPMLQPAYRLTGGKEHPWPFAQWQQPLHKHISQMYGADAPAIIQGELDAMQGLYLKVQRFVIEVGTTLGACGGPGGPPVGVEMGEIIDYMMRSVLPTEIRDRLWVMRENDKRFSRDIARVNFCLCAFSAKMRRILKLQKQKLEGSPSSQALVGADRMKGRERLFNVGNRIVLQNVDKAAAKVRREKANLVRRREDNAFELERIMRERGVSRDRTAPVLAASAAAVGAGALTERPDPLSASALGASDTEDPPPERPSPPPVERRASVRRTHGSGRRRSSAAPPQPEAGAPQQPQPPSARRRQSRPHAAPSPGRTPNRGHRASVAPGTSAGVAPPQPASDPRPPVQHTPKRPDRQH